MKKRLRLPLFRHLEPDVYVIDSSSWLKVDTRTDSEDVWRLIFDLIENGRIIACNQVLAELREDPIYMLRLKPYEEALQAGHRNDVAYLQQVGKITHDHPAMCKPTGLKTRADPYIVALADLERYVVVSDESRKKRANRKIPGVCTKLSIKCLTLDQFITAAGP